MHYTLDKYHLQAEVDTKECKIPDEEKPRIQQGLDRIGEAVQDFADSRLWLTVVYHPKSDTYHVQAKLKVPGETIITGERDTYLDAAYQRCVQRILHRVEAYRLNPDQKAVRQAEARSRLANDLVAPADPDFGPLGEAVARDDYRAFRRALRGREEWARMRVMSWASRYPDVLRRLGSTFEVEDLVEEVFINAFEHYPRRPTSVPFPDWLESLIAPSVKAFHDHPVEETERVRYAQSMRDTP